MARREKACPVGTAELFDPGPRVPKPAGERTRAPRAVAHGRCPRCTGDRVAIVRSPSHLIWREHRFTTHSGAKLVCPASLVPLCRAPDRSGETGCHHPAMSLE